MPEERCENCRFWKETADDGSAGECQRYPKQIRTDQFGMLLGASFPQMEPDDWCGEWKPTQKDDAPEGESYAIAVMRNKLNA